MAKLKGLFSRKGVLYLRVLIPSDLREAYNGRTQIVHSLHTRDRREAERIGTNRRGELLDEFEDKLRALNPQPIATITPELGATLAASIKARLLARDDAVRASPAAAEVWLRFIEWAKAQALAPLRIGPVPPLVLPTREELDALAGGSPFAGLTPAQFAKLAALNLDDDVQAAASLATRQLAPVVPLADSEARRLGLLVDWKAPEARPVLVDCLRAYRAAMADIVNSDRGEDVPTPPAPESVRDALIAFMAATAQAQAEAIKEAQKAGIKAARAGEDAAAKYRGRKPTFDTEQLQRTHELLSMGWSASRAPQHPQRYTPWHQLHTRAVKCLPASGNPSVV